MPSDWIWGLLGGGIIGCAAALFLLVNGQIMGASGIIGALVDGSAGNQMTERSWFIAGLIGVPALLVIAMGGAQTWLTGNWAMIVAGGLLVGIGTRLANGCTSGHGVCGISRLSLRGIVATVFYIGAGGLAVIAIKHMAWVA